MTLIVYLRGQFLAFRNVQILVAAVKRIENFTTVLVRKLQGEFSLQV